VITCLLIALVIASLRQPNAPRFLAAVAFVGMTLAHEFFFSGSEGAMYYGTAAAFDLAMIAMTSKINPIPKMVLNLHKVCLMSIVVNFAGWVMWFLYLPPTLYDASFVVVYTLAVVALFSRGREDVGDFALDSWYSCFLLNRSSWANNSHKHQGKA